MEIKKVQFTLSANKPKSPGNAIRRQHYIPPAVHHWVLKKQMEIRHTKGVKRTEVPTIPDIYLYLITKGATMATIGSVIPAFVEFGRPADRVAVQIKIPNLINLLLVGLKERADAGEFEVQGAKEISLISVALALIKIAIEETKPKRQQ